MCSVIQATLKCCNDLFDGYCAKCSNSGAAGSRGTSGAATPRIGASRQSNACSARMADTSAPMPRVRLSSCTTTARLVVVTDSRNVSASSGAKVRRSTTYAWVPIDGTHDLGPGPGIDPLIQEQAYPLSRCMSCCLCMEVCPQFNEATRFVGAAIINQVRLFNLQPTGDHLRHARLEAMMGDGGIHECSYAQKCVQICPKSIPLTASISIVNGQAVRQAIGDLFQQTELTSKNRPPGHR